MPCLGDGQDEGLAGPGCLHLLLALPRAPQAVQTRAGRPRRTPKEQPWERLAVHNARLEEVALVCFPAAPGASFPLRVCFTSQQLSAVEGWPPSGPGPWSPRCFQSCRGRSEQLSPWSQLPDSAGFLAIETTCKAAEASIAEHPLCARPPLQQSM